MTEAEKQAECLRICGPNVTPEMHSCAPEMCPVLWDIWRTKKPSFATFSGKGRGRDSVKTGMVIVLLAVAGAAFGQAEPQAVPMPTVKLVDACKKGEYLTVDGRCLHDQTGESHPAGDGCNSMTCSDAACRYGVQTAMVCSHPDDPAPTTPAIPVQIFTPSAGTSSISLAPYPPCEFYGGAVLTLRGDCQIKINFHVGPKRAKCHLSFAPKTQGWHDDGMYEPVITCTWNPKKEKAKP